jgi:translation elongation factor EF-Tu-like GTPase
MACMFLNCHEDKLMPHRNYSLESVVLREILVQSEVRFQIARKTARIVGNGMIASTHIPQFCSRYITS